MIPEDAIKVPIVNGSSGETIGEILYFNGHEGPFLLGDWIEFDNKSYEIVKRTWKGWPTSALEITVQPEGKRVTIDKIKELVEWTSNLDRDLAVEVDELFHRAAIYGIENKPDRD